MAWFSTDTEWILISEARREEPIFVPDGGTAPTQSGLGWMRDIVVAQYEMRCLTEAYAREVAQRETAAARGAAAQYRPGQHPKVVATATRQNDAGAYMVAKTVETPTAWVRQ